MNTEYHLEDGQRAGRMKRLMKKVSMANVRKKKQDDSQTQLHHQNLSIIDSNSSFSSVSVAESSAVRANNDSNGQYGEGLRNYTSMMVSDNTVNGGLSGEFLESSASVEGSSIHSVVETQTIIMGNVADLDTPLSVEGRNNVEGEAFAVADVQARMRKLPGWGSIAFLSSTSSMRGPGGRSVLPKRTDSFADSEITLVPSKVSTMENAPVELQRCAAIAYKNTQPGEQPTIGPEPEGVIVASEILKRPRLNSALSLPRYFPEFDEVEEDKCEKTISFGYATLRIRSGSTTISDRHASKTSEDLQIREDPMDAPVIGPKAMAKQLASMPRLANVHIIEEDLKKPLPPTIVDNGPPPQISQLYWISDQMDSERKVIPPYLNVRDGILWTAEIGKKYGIPWEGKYVVPHPDEPGITTFDWSEEDEDEEDEIMATKMAEVIREFFARPHRKRWSEWLQSDDEHSEGGNEDDEERRLPNTYDVNGDNWEVARAKFSRLELFDSIRILGTEEFSYIVIERVNLSPALGHVRVGTAKAFVRCIVECIDGDISAQNYLNTLFDTYLFWTNEHGFGEQLLDLYVNGKDDHKTRVIGLWKAWIERQSRAVIENPGGKTIMKKFFAEAEVHLQNLIAEETDEPKAVLLDNQLRRLVHLTQTYKIAAGRFNIYMNLRNEANALSFMAASRYISNWDTEMRETSQVKLAGITALQFGRYFACLDYMMFRDASSTYNINKYLNRKYDKVPEDPWNYVADEDFTSVHEVVARVMRRPHLIRNWLFYELISLETPEAKTLLVSKMIEAVQYLLSMGNLQTSMPIVEVLSCSEVRNWDIWGLVPRGCKASLRNAAKAFRTPRRLGATYSNTETCVPYFPTWLETIEKELDDDTIFDKAEDDYMERFAAGTKGANGFHSRLPTQPVLNFHNLEKHSNSLREAHRKTKSELQPPGSLGLRSYGCRLHFPTIQSLSWMYVNGRCEAPVDRITQILELEGNLDDVSKIIEQRIILAWNNSHLIPPEFRIPRPNEIGVDVEEVFDRMGEHMNDGTEETE